MSQLRETLKNLSLPFNISVDLILTSLNLTTVCYRDFNGQEQCQCEDEYLWPCDICETYGACNNTSLQSCNCINGIPSDGQYCERSVNITCPPPPPPPPVETSVDAVLSARTLFTEPRELIIRLKEAIENITLPFNVTVDLRLTSLIFTTVCFRDFNGQEQCQCEDEYLWSCDICEMYGACSNTSMQICDCINTIPSDGQRCELGVNTMCPPTTTTSTTPSLSTTTPSSAENLPTDMQTIDVRSLLLTLEIDFDDSYNDENNGVFQRCLQSIATQSRIHIPELLSSELLGFRFGSTIMDFEITANTTIQDEDVDALLTALFNDLRIDFPIRFESRRNLTFQLPSVFFGDSLNVTCGPPPEGLEFRIERTEWTLDDAVIIEDIIHSFSRANGAETLTITNFFFTDNGLYQCQLFDGESSFLQDSNEPFSLLETPIVQTVPLQNKILCEAGQQVPIQCSVQDPYQVRFNNIPNTGTGPVIQQLITITQEDCDNQELIITCEVVENSRFTRNITLLLINDGTFTCVADPDFGNGFLNDVGRASCESEQVGQKTAICRASGEWEARDDNCTLQRITQLLIQSTLLTEETLEEFLDELRNVTLEQSDEVVQSPNDIEAVVRILNNVSNFVTTFGITISQDSMEDVLFVTDVLTRDAARESWDILNFEAIIESIDPRTITPRNESVSSLLLFALEGITRRLVNASFGIETPLILLNKTTFINNFNGDFNSTVEIEIQEADGATNLTVITFETMNNVIPPRDGNNFSGRVINGRVVLVQSDTIIDNITFTFDIVNNSLGNPQCVFWNFSLSGGLGGWDDEGCELVGEDETVTCQCDHLTSFSILMSPIDIISRLLDFISYIGVGISMASLVICLIIEAFILRKVSNNATSYLRHVSIVNIAVCLLIANIWFIVGASISEEPRNRRNPDVCTAATFFIHLFYLALFFWMLSSALLLFYRLIWIFGGRLSTNTMLAIGFSLGYGAPLLIAVVTIAVTAPNDAYIRENVICWLNWDTSRALLAFVVPALVIVFINIIILIVVTVKILQSRGMTNNVQEDEKYVLVVIIRSLAILTPFFGITWGLGVGILIDPSNIGIHIAFAFFNSLQGFFILVFGTLLDKKVRSEIAVLTSSQFTRSGTKTTSAGSSSGWQIFKNLGRRGGNNVSSNISSSSQAINT
ncbi:adhesion G-protein coupled receptor F1-like [Vanacampus margaritifer]